MSVGQLWYGWAAVGAEGVNMEQIIAGSGVLADRRQPLTRLVLESCYPPLEPCFGWSEAEGVRIAFRRAPTGVDGRGRPGNFFVHVLVAQPDALPPATLARLWNSPLWALRAPDGPPPVLDALNLGAVELSGPAEPDRLAVRNALAGHLANVADGVRSALSTGEEEAVAIAARIAAALPPRFGLLAFVTRENADRAHRYDLIAGPAPEGLFQPLRIDQAPDANWSAAAELLLDAAPGGAVDALADQARTLQAFAAALRHWARLTRPRPSAERHYDASDLQTLRGAAIDARLTAALIAGPGLERLAPAFAEGVPEAVDAVAAARPKRVGPLAETLAAAFAEPATAIHQLATIAGRSPALTLATAQHAASRWLDEDRLGSLAREDAVRLLRLLGDGETTHEIVALLADARYTGAIVADAALPAAWRALAAARHPEAVDSQALGRALTEPNGFARALLTEGEGPVLRAIGAAIGGASPGQARTILQVAGPLAPVEVADGWRWLLAERSAGADERFRRMSELLISAHQPSASWYDVTLDAFVAAVLELRDTHEPLPRLLSVALRRGSGERVRTWRELADAFERHPQPERAAWCVARLDGEDREAALDVVLSYATRDAYHAESWTGAARVLRSGSGFTYIDTALAMARAIPRPDVRYRSELAFSVIYWIAGGIEQGWMPPDALEIDALARLGELVAKPDYHDQLKELRGVVKDRRLRGWLKDASAASSRAVKARQV